MPVQIGDMHTKVDVRPPDTAAAVPAAAMTPGNERKELGAVCGPCVADPARGARSAPPAAGLAACSRPLPRTASSPPTSHPACKSACSAICPLPPDGHAAARRRARRYRACRSDPRVPAPASIRSPSTIRTRPRRWIAHRWACGLPMPGTLQLSSGNQPLWPRYSLQRFRPHCLRPAAAGGHALLARCDLHRAVPHAWLAGAELGANGVRAGDRHALRVHPGWRAADRLRRG